jgi:hypothetical protein
MKVLAFESDATQADAIRHVVCDLVGARLTVATSIEKVLHELRAFTPDLVLLPALVSPNQEAALLETLRSLPDASHIDTLITPVLPPRSTGSIVAPPGWRRWTSRRATPAQPTSAEASAFAERVRWALERARERKKHHVSIEERPSVIERQDAAVEPLVESAVEAAPDEMRATLETVERETPETGLVELVTMSLETGLVEAPSSLVELLANVADDPVRDPQELELADATSRLLKKLSQPSGGDRRQYRRFSARELPGLQAARIKSGPNVALVDVSAGGALLESDTQLQPESEALLELVGNSRHTVVPIRVVRCHLAALNGSPRYLGACAFKKPLDLDELAWTAATISETNGPGLTLVPARAVIRNAW